jgi:hypothetical protein
MNKKGQIGGIIIFGFILIVIMMVGFIFGIGGAVTTWTADTVLPELANLGVVEGINMTENANYVIEPVNNIVQNFSWMTGVLYVLLLIGTIGIAMTFRITGNKWLIGLFFVVMIMVILASILFSNMYEDFHTGNDSFSLELQSYTLLSFLIINSPLIVTVIGFVAGIIMFSGMEGEVV